MSHHSIYYRVYPDDMATLSHEAWRKADDFVNGVTGSRDLNTAIAFAKLAVKSTHYPFVVMAVPIGGVRTKMCEYIVIGEKYNNKQK